MPKEKVRNTSSFKRKKSGISTKLEQVLKSVTVSDVEEHADCPETIYNALIDLVKLENKKNQILSYLIYKRKHHIRWAILVAALIFKQIKRVILFGICQIQKL